MSQGKERFLALLGALHLKSVVDHVYLWARAGIRRVRNNTRRETFFKDFERFNEEECLPEKFDTGSVLLFGHLTTPRKPGLMEFLKRWQGTLGEKEFYIIEEGHKYDEIPFPILMFPRTITRWDSHLPMPLRDKVETAIEKHPELAAATENFAQSKRGRGQGYAQEFIFQTWKSLGLLLEAAAPSIVVMWTAFSAPHMILKWLCDQRGIPILYLEFGSLPGTFSIDRSGQMGESWPALHPEEFMAQPVTEEELEKTRQVLKYLYRSKTNRNVQPDTQDELNLLRRQLKPGRPTILYAGQNDCHSGVVPYSEHSKEFHSPIFKSTFDTCSYLATIAEENDWNLIFKPHPRGQRLHEGELYVCPENVFLIKKVDIHDLIDMVDVVVVIMSQTSYVSLIRGKPTVLLGYNQLRGKHCAYEARALEEVVPTIQAAIEQGRTDEQKKAFERHIAQMLKSCLYDDLKTRNLRFGRLPESYNLDDG